MRFVITFSFLLLLMMPSLAGAAVIINEIAWMGDSVSANHEWLELYNNSDSRVSLDGWIIKDGLNLEIPLSGNIEALGYAVLERTSEESAPGTALLLYTGALVNTGATLTIYNAEGGVADQVAGGENWLEVGGDNATKETAQYNSSGWVTDEATAGALNKTGRAIDVEDTPPPIVTEATNTNPVIRSKTSSGSASNQTVRLVTLNTELKLKVDFQTIAYVNQPIDFKVESSGIGESVMDSLKYTWNFGDTNTAIGKKATHAYAYPGTYVVTLRANYARHNEVVRQEITVLPVTFSITKNDTGDVQIHNNAPYDVELSGFSVLGTSDLVFPPDTIIIPRGTITIKASKLGLLNKNQTVTLLDQEETLIASTESLSSLASMAPASLAIAKVSTNKPPVLSEKISIKTTDTGVLNKTFDFVKSPTENISVGSTTEVAQLEKPAPIATLSATKAMLVDSEAESKTSKSRSTENSWAYLALIGLLFLGFVGLLLRTNNQPRNQKLF